MSNTLCELDGLLVQLELYNKRVKIVANDLSETYFSIDDEKMLLFYQDIASTKCDIVKDYIIRMDNTLKKINEIMKIELKDKEINCENILDKNDYV